MPKSLKEINNFNKGIILHASEKDVVEDSSTFSLNVNPNSKEGILSGIKTNNLIASTGGIITKAIYPWTWGTPTNDNTTDGVSVFPTFANSSLFLEDVSKFEDISNINLNFVGIKGYSENINALNIAPHMERLRVNPQLGNATTSTYPRFEPNISTISKTATVIDMADSNTTVDLSTLSEGDYIQFTTTAYYVGSYSNEIMKILGVDSSGNTITVKRGIFNSVPKTYAAGTLYYININKMSVGGKGLQKSTFKGYAIIGYGWSQISGNHAKGNGSLFDTNGATVLKNTGTTTVFDADAKTMTVTSNSTLRKYLTTGDTFTFYSNVGSYSNHGSRFTIKAYTGTGVFHLKETPVSETIVDSNIAYFEPGLINNCTFSHKVGSGVGDGQINKVNDWAQYKLNTDSTAGNQFETSTSNSYIAQESSGLYSDTNVFGSDLSADYYPYIDKSLSILAQYDDTQRNLGEGLTVTDVIIFTDAPVYNTSLFSSGDILKIGAEYMRVISCSNQGINVERGYLNSTIIEHTSGADIYKNGMWNIRNSISKDLIKPDTTYELSFWTKIKTGTAATTTLTCVHDTASNYDEKDFTLTSSAGTVKTYTFETTNAGDGSTDTGDLDGDGKVLIQISGLSDKDDIAEQTRLAIVNANGHNSEITAARTDNALALAQAYAGEEGNTIVSHTLVDSHFTCPDFSNGKSSKPVFALDYNGGYFDGQGDFKINQLSDIDKNIGIESVQSAVPTNNIKWNPFSVCKSVFDDSIGLNHIDGIKWRNISYTFRTPFELPKNDLILSYSNFGQNAQAMQLAVVNLSESCFVTANAGITSDIIASSFIKHSEIETLITYDSATSALSVIENFSTTNKNPLSNTQSFEVSPTAQNKFQYSRDVSMVQKNREMHIGFGPKSADSNPAWLGYLNSTLFGQENTGLYLDEDKVPPYESVGASSFSKICLAGEYECIDATWTNGSTILTVDMGSGNVHSLKAGDNITVREYLDADNSWAGTGVWFVSAVTNTQVFVCRRNVSLDVNPPNNGSMDGDNDYKISWRPYFYYGIMEGVNSLYRIWPDDRISGTAAANVGFDKYKKGTIEQFLDFEYPIKSICTSYSKRGNTPDGGHVYLLQGGQDKISRVFVMAGYDVASSTLPSQTEVINITCKSFKWSNDNINGDIGGDTEVFEGLSEESTPSINYAGKLSDITETKGPITTFDWDNTDNEHATVAPAHFDTRLWLQSYPLGEDAVFTTGDRFLFCGKSTFISGENDMKFADRTPPTTTLYGSTYGLSNNESFSTQSYAGGGRSCYTVSHGPYIDLNYLTDDYWENNDIDAIDLKASSYFYQIKHSHNNNTEYRLGKISPYENFNSSTGEPDTHAEDADGGLYSATDLDGDQTSSYINYGYNTGWLGDGSKKAAIKVAKYGLFGIADNDCDGILDGTGVVVPNNESYSSNNIYGELHRKMSSHAVGLLGGSDVPWIGFGGQVNGQIAGYSIGDKDEHVRSNDSPISYDVPYDIDATNCVFVCTDMHFGDMPQKQKYSIIDGGGGIATDADIGGAGAAYYTKITTTEAHYLQSGDLVYFKGSGGTGPNPWVGFGSTNQEPYGYSGTATLNNKGSYTVIAVPSSTTFYVAEASGSSKVEYDNGAEVWIGGPWFNTNAGIFEDTGRMKTNIFHYAFDSEDKLNSDIFNNGHFGPKWYTDTNALEVLTSECTDAQAKSLYPSKASLIERLNWESGFLIRPINSQNFDINFHTSVEMPVFPDKIYHKGTAVKSSNIENQFSGKLFITSSSEVSSTGDDETSQVHIFDWNLYNPVKPTLGINNSGNQFPYNYTGCKEIENIYCRTEAQWADNSSIVGPSVNDGVNSITTWLTNNSAWNRPTGGGAYSSIPIVSYISSNDTALGLEDATNHPVIKIAKETTSPRKYKNSYAGYCIIVVDGTTGTTQARKIIGSLDDNTNTLLSVHFPFGHAPCDEDTVFIVHSSKMATIPVSLYQKQEAMSTFNLLTADPIASATIMPNSGDITSISGSGTIATVTCTAYHMLQNKDFVQINDSENFDGDYEITITGPKIFTFSHTYNSSGTADGGATYKILEMDVATSNPVLLPMAIPKLKMSFGGFDSRKLREYPVTAIADDTDDIRFTSAANLLANGDMLSFKSEMITAENDRTFASASNWIEYHVGGSAPTFGDDGSPANLEITQVEDVNTQGAQLPVESMETSVDDRVYRITAELWTNSGTLTNVSMGIGGTASSTFSITTDKIYYTKEVEAGSDAALIISSTHNGAIVWNIDNVTVEDVAQNAVHTVKDAATDTVDALNTDYVAVLGRLYTNQWEGIISSASGNSYLGEFRVGLNKLDKGASFGNLLRGDVEDDTRFFKQVDASVLIRTTRPPITTGYFLKNNVYRYKISLIYDGYQEGPLNSTPWTYSDVVANDDLSVNIKLQSNEISKRISHVCLYRKDNIASFYRLIKQIPTSTGWSNVNNSTREIQILDTGKVKASYEARTNTSEVNRDLSVKYSMSVEVNGYLFAGNCSHNEIKNASNQIFRSKIGRFSLFNWANDFVILKSTPTAMANFAGRLYVFDENNIYKINPESLQIEDTFEGIGCSNSKSVIVTEFGMFFANKNGAYLHNGSIPEKISTPIQTGGKTNMLSLTNSSFSGTDELEDLSWENTGGNINNSPPVVSFDPSSNCALFFVQFRDNELLSSAYLGSNITSKKAVSIMHNLIWAYSIEKNRWDLWELDKQADLGIPFTNKTGTVCLAVGNNIYSLFTGGNKKLYSWLSKKFIMGTSTTNKVFNKVKVIGPKQSLINDGTYETESDKIIIATDNGRVTSGSNSTTANITLKSQGSETYDYRLSGSNKKGKWIQFKLEEMEEDVDSIGIIYRLRAVK